MPLQIIEDPVEDYPLAVVVKLSGELDSYTSAILREYIKKALGRYRFFAIDMAGISFVSSMGWGILVESIYKARQLGGDLVLVNLQPKVQRIFKIMGFHTFFKCFSDLDDAVRFMIKKK
ncbi:MAG: STAS domain-containing protein [Thermotogae bacterium]|nr:STAS domain-containing protein [Thermotogota bacterium]